MAFEDCMDEVAKAIGRPLTKDEQKELGQNAKDLVNKFKNSDELEKALADGYNSEATAAFQAKRNAALNAQAGKIKFDQHQNAYYDAPEKFWHATAGRANIQREGALAGIGGKISTTIDMYHQRVDAAIKKAGLENFIKTPENDEAVFLAKAHLDKGVPENDLIQKYGKDAVALAKIFNEAGDVQRNNTNRAGANIGDFSGYSFKRSADPTRVMTYGDARVGDPVNREAFVKDLMQRLDWNESFKEGGAPVPENRREQVLSNLFDAHSTGVHLKFSDGDSGAAPLGLKNVGKALSKGRDLIFKTPEDEYAYYKKVAGSANVTEAFYQQSRHTARSEAIMKEFGPNAEMNVRDLEQKIYDTYAKKGDRELAVKSRDQFKKFMKYDWPTITGETSIPLTRGWFNSLAQGLRDTLNGKYLGAVNFAQLGHSATAGLAEQRFNENNFSDFFRGVHETIKGMAKSLRATRLGSAVTGADHTVKSADLAEFGRVLGFSTEGLHSPVNVYTNEFDAPGVLSRSLHRMLNVLGSYDIRNGAKAAAGKMLSADLISHLDTEFEGLPLGKKDLLNKFNIKPGEWNNIIRKTAPGENPTWGKYFSPYDVGEGAEAAIKGEIQSQRDAAGITKKITARDVENFKSDLQFKMLNMFHEYGSIATGEPTGQVRAALLRGTQPGTLEGEAARSIAQLKSFSVNYLRNHVDAELRGYDPENLSLKDAIGKMFTDPNKQAVKGMVSVMTLVPMIGYFSHSLRQMAMNKMPHIPHDAESLLDAYITGTAQSAGMGLYSDFLFGKQNRFGGNIVSSAAGPTAQFGIDLTSILNKAFTKSEGLAFGNEKEQNKKLAPEALRFGLNYTPVLNTYYNNYYTHAALDYLIVNHMYETMNPGYLRRMERETHKEQGQHFLVSPSNYLGH